MVMVAERLEPWTRVRNRPRTTHFPAYLAISISLVDRNLSGYYTIHTEDNISILAIIQNASDVLK